MGWREAFRRAPVATQCARCRHFANDRDQVERELPGLLVLSSAFGDSWGDAGLCRRHRVMLLPFNTCVGFAARHTAPGSPPDTGR